MFNVDDIETTADVVEEEVFRLDIITSFECRGWGLYEYDKGGFINSLDDIKDIVSKGRAQNKISYNVRYILLPLLDNDADWNIIKDLTEKIIMAGRGPYFVDLNEGVDDNGKWVETLGVYLVDSVVVVPPFIYLVIDKRMSFTRVPNKEIGDSIELHLTKLYKIRKQLMLALRG